MIIQKKTSPNLKDNKLISFYNNVPSTFECLYDQQHSWWREKASQKYQTRNSKKRQIGFLSFFFSSDGLAQYMLEPFIVVYARNNSILYGIVHNPIAFSQLLSLTRHFRPLTQKLWLPVWDAIFFICVHACALIDHLTTT